MVRAHPHPRTHLYPLHGGPWLDDRADARTSRWMVGVGLVLVLSTAMWMQVLLWWYTPPPGVFPSVRYDPSGWFCVPLIGGAMLCLGGLLVALANALPRRDQTCPQCLSTMRYGARVCPHCHCDPDKETRHVVRPPRR
jgi:hypothetical protein